LIGFVALALFMLEIALIRAFVAPAASPGSNGNEAGTTLVVTAATDLPAGHLLGAGDVLTEPFSYERVKTSLIAAAGRDKLVGRRLEWPVRKGDPVLAGSLYQTGAKRLLNSIPAGKRLFTIPHSEESSAVPLVRGDVVDIVGHLQLPQKGFVTKSLLEAIPVAWNFSRDGEAESGGIGGQGLAFYLTPDEVAFLVQARKFGRFEIVLRNPRDTTRDRTEGMTENGFLNDPRIREVYQNDLFQIRR
jgi:Flp pilus assembly protein CpaB